MGLRRLATCLVLSVAFLVVTGCAGVSTEEDLPGSRAPGTPGIGAPEEEPLPDLGPDATLDEALAYAALESPRLRAAFETWRAALEKIPQVGAWPDPRFTFAWFVRSVETRVGPQRRRYALSQAFPWFGELALREDVASRAAEAARARVDEAWLALARDVEVAWLDLWELERSIQIVRENVKLLEVWEAVARARYTTAVTGHPDLLRAQVEQARQEDRLRGLVDRRTPLAARLNAVLGRPVEAPVPRPAALPMRPLAEDEEALRLRLETESPALRALDLDAEKEDRAAALAEKDLYPDVTLGLEVIETDEARMDGTPDSGKDPVVAMVSLTLPLHRDRVRAAVREARRRRRAVLERREAERLRLRAELERALFDRRDADRRIDLYRDTLIPKSRQWVETATTAFQTGRVDLEHLLDAWRSLLEFQLSLERTRAGRERARARIESLVGGPAGEEDGRREP